MHLHYPTWWNDKKIAYFLAIFLGPVCILYYVLGWLRQVLTKSRRLHQSFVLCVGNFSVGGTGKTQLVEYLATKLTKSQIHFVIVMKAYKGSLRGGVIATMHHSPAVIGDEAACFVANGYIVIAAHKLRDALPIIQTIKPQVVLLDDGMQNPYLEKDYIIATIDGNRGLGNQMLIPLGPMRTNHPKHIDTIVITNPKSQINKNNEANNKLLNETLKFCTKHVKHQVITAHTILLPTIHPKTKARIAFSGIGNNCNFFSQLQREGFNIIDTVSFADHHKYDLRDILVLQQKALASDAILTTTFKDYVKCKTYCTKLELEIECINSSLLMSSTEMFDDILNKITKSQILKMNT